MLPYAKDQVLLSELAAVVSAGWGLPARPNRANDVRHLLLLADPTGGLTYRQAAQRFLTMLDDALRRCASENDSPLSEDDAAGLRILFGVAPNYRNEASPVVRRHDAAVEYLVPRWRDRPPVDPAATFQRRHQERALRQALDCLRATFGQAEGPGIRDYDVLERRRWYEVGARHQVVVMRGEDVVRFREDGIEFFVFTESKRDEEGLLKAEFKTLAHARGPAVTLGGIEDVETQPGLRAITMKLPRAYRAGETIGVAWEETCEYGPEAPEWKRYFAAVEAPNDNAEMEATVHFTDETDLPKLGWHYIALPEVDHSQIGPRPDEKLFLDDDRQTGHRWNNAETERRIEYCLQWSWVLPASFACSGLIRNTDRPDG